MTDIIVFVVAILVLVTIIIYKQAEVSSLSNIIECRDDEIKKLTGQCEWHRSKLQELKNGSDKLYGSIVDMQCAIENQQERLEWYRKKFPDTEPPPVRAINKNFTEGRLDESEAIGEVMDGYSSSAT